MDPWIVEVLVTGDSSEVASMPVGTKHVGALECRPFVKLRDAS